MTIRGPNGGNRLGAWMSIRSDGELERRRIIYSNGTTSEGEGGGAQGRNGCFRNNIIQRSAAVIHLSSNLSRLGIQEGTNQLNRKLSTPRESAYLSSFERYSSPLSLIHQLRRALRSSKTHQILLLRLKILMRNTSTLMNFASLLCKCQECR
jgi:hypothetical protein